MKAAPEEGKPALAQKTPTPRGTEAVVRFCTKLGTHLQVPEDDLVVPSNLGRYGLSEVINRLLSSEKPVPFDFLVNGEFLRTSIIQYLEARNLSSEKVLILEYVLAVTEPEHSQIDQAPDWIAGVAALGAIPTNWFAAVSCDGTLRIYEGEQSRLVTQVANQPLTAVAALPTQDARGSASLLVVAGKDGATRCCAVHYGERGAQLGGISTLRSRTQGSSANEAARAVQTAAISEDGTLMASGGWDTNVQIWNVLPAFFDAPDAATSPAAGSKRKGVADAGVGCTPKFTLQGHSQVVSCLRFGERSRFPFSLFSGSWDCSLRVWDLAAGSCVCNWTVARAVTSLSVSPDAPRLATSHEDGHVSLWDVRAPPHPTIAGAVSLDVTAGLPLSSAQSPHRRLVSQVAWCPQDGTRLASVSHDGHLCILDQRSPKMPLQALRLGQKGKDPTKLLGCCWLDKEIIAVGGSDGKVVRVRIGDAHAAITVA